MNIDILINTQKFKAQLNNTETAQKIYEILPLKAEGRFWGNEIYFEIPLALQNENPVERVSVGDLAYWPQGKGFCIFYGRTPLSDNDEPKPAGPVTVIGHLQEDPEKLKAIEKADIKIKKSN